MELALAALADRPGEAKIVAGGTAVTIMLRQRLIQPEALVSLGRIPGLDRITLEKDALSIGAMVTHHAIERSSLIRNTIPVLADTFAMVANIRVRNSATVGGVLAEADYASDPPCVLRALGATVIARGSRGERTIPLDSFFLGFYQAAIEADEVLTEVRIPIPPVGTRAVYLKYVSRSSEDRPCVGVAAVARLDKRGLCHGLHVVLGAIADRPQEFESIERTAEGQPLKDELIANIATEYARGVEPVSDLLGSSWYRSQMVAVWVRRALQSLRDDVSTTQPAVALRQ